MTDFPHVAKALAYIDGVTSGEILAGVHVRRACERHRRDVERESDPAWPYRFDAEKAERVCKFIELLPHVKGEWARAVPGNPKANRLRLEPWQCFVVSMMFGWVQKANGFRRFRKASLYIPRKNAKSTLAAGIGWWMFAKDDEPGAEVYSGATSEKQAWEVFGPARQMALSSPKLPEGLGVLVNAKSLVRPGHNCKFEPVIGKPGDGASPHCAIVDEYHEHPTSVLYDTMLTGMGARRQPLLLIISTAGDNISGPCRGDWLLMEKILAQTLHDETHFGVIWSADEGDSWNSETALRKANPNFDVSVRSDFLLAQLATAEREAIKQGIYKIKHLNQWVTARNAFFNLESWRKLADPKLKIEDFAGQSCFMAIDLAAKIDLAVLIIIFPIDENRIAVFGRYYAPDATVQLPENQHYQKWQLEGHLIVTPGNMTDHTLIRDDVFELKGKYQVKELAYDPDGATMLVNELTAEGVTCVEIPQTMGMLSDPMKHVDAMIRSGWIAHTGDPVMEYAISNVIAQHDRGDRVKPTKERPENKIDPAVGLIMAVHRLINQEPASAGAGVMFFN